MKSHENEEMKKFSIFDIFRHRKLTYNTVILAYGFFANTMVYYGLNFNVDSLSGNLYLNRKNKIYKLYILYKIYNPNTKLTLMIDLYNTENII